MKRYVSLEDISDGHLYTSEDLVKAGCGDCKGCSDCCKSMADTVSYTHLTLPTKLVV